MVDYAGALQMSYVPTGFARNSTTAPTYQGQDPAAEEMKVHTMLVVGNRDREANAVSLRVHGKGNLGAKPRAEVIADILQSIKERRP